MLPSGLPEQVHDEEDLARFLVQSNQYSSVGIKPIAFLPHPVTQDVSVSRHGAEPTATLLELGLAATPGRTLHGAAILKARVARAVGLKVDADEPPPRHALIHGWPQVRGDAQLQKAHQRAVALELASQAETMVPLR